MRLVPIGDVDLEVEELGSGEPVVVIQTALTADELRPLSRQIGQSGQYHVVHCHRRGYAGSGPASLHKSVTADAADTAALIRVMDAAPAHVVGVSYSAAVGLTLAASAPEIVQTLTVVEPPPVGTPAASSFQQANKQLLEDHRDAGPQAALDRFLTMLLGRDWRAASEAYAPGSVAAMEADAATFFGSDIPALLSWRFDAAAAARIRCPVMYVGGSDSASWFTEMRTRIVRLLPSAEAVTVDGAGHLLASTHSAAVAALILGHLRRHPRRADV